MSFTVLHLERTIDASHVIPGHPGKCGRLHGHTYRFQVWLSGEVDAESGMLVDFYDVKRVIDAWDHRHLNDEVDFVPTAELLAAEARRRLLALMGGGGGEGDAARGDAAERNVGVLVRLWETPGGYAECGWLTRDPAAPAGAEVPRP